MKLSSVFPTIVDGLKSGLNSLSFALAIFILPVLAAWLSLFILAAISIHVLKLGALPFVISSAVLAAFLGLVYSSWLRWHLSGERPQRLLVPNIDSQALNIAVIFAGWWVCLGSIEWTARQTAMSAVQTVASKSTELYWIFGILSIEFLLKAALNTVAFGLVFTVIAMGNPDFKATIQLIRKSPLAIFLIGGFATFAQTVVGFLYNRLLFIEGLRELVFKPTDRYESLMGFLLLHLGYFLLMFISFFLFASLMTEAYKRLLYAEENVGGLTPGHA